MRDPLTDIVLLMNPKASTSKLVEGAGPWRVIRKSEGEAFYCVVLEGGCEISVNNEEIQRLSSGDFILVPSTYTLVNTSIDQAPMKTVSHPQTIAAGHVRIGNTDGPVELRMLVGHCQFDTKDKDLILSLLPKHIAIKGQHRISTIVGLLLDESRANRPGREVVQQGFLQLLMIEALRSTEHLNSSSGIVKGLADARLNRAITLIHSHPDQYWNISHLAKRACMSRSAFFTRFNTVVGITPMKYLQFWRMALAKKMLLETRATTDIIAEKIGYKSASAFSTAFSKFVGVSPSQYRSQT